MSVGWFTSRSIDEPFEWCGNIGKGHPDPDVMFAEGKFYLATQQKDDFVSPGPWVEDVHVRVGVDTDNDKQIDKVDRLDSRQRKLRLREGLCEASREDAGVARSVITA